MQEHVHSAYRTALWRTKSGVWNVTEAWPLMLSSVSVTGCLPKLDEPLNWLPVEVAAKAVAEVTFADTDTRKDEKGQETIPVYHILNPYRNVTWGDLLGWMKKMVVEFEVVEPREWLERLERSRGNHPAKKSLGLWKSLYGGEGTEDGQKVDKDSRKKCVEFQMEETERVIRAMRDVTEITEEHFRAIWRWIEREMDGRV